MHTPKTDPGVSQSMPARAARVRYDADRAESAGQVPLLDVLNAMLERSASTIDGDVNTVEASEERLAAFDSQLMR